MCPCLRITRRVAIVAVTQLLVRQRVERNGRCAVRVELKLFPCTHTYLITM